MNPLRTFPFRVWSLGLVIAASLAVAHSAAAQTPTQLYDSAVESVKAGDIPEAKTKLQQALQVDRNFRPASILLARIADQEKAAAAPTALTPTKALERMTVPVDFKDTTLQSGLEYIRQRVEADSKGAVMINFVLNLPPELQNKRVTVQLSHVPVMDTLRYIGNLAGVTFQVQPYAIVVSPAAGPAPPPGASAAVTP